MLLKIGDKVKIKDGSYMLGIDLTNNRLTHYIPGEIPIGLSKDIFVVIVTNVLVPADKENVTGILTPFNNCIIRNTRTGNIWFCSEINIERYKPKKYYYPTYKSPENGLVYCSQLCKFQEHKDVYIGSTWCDNCSHNHDYNKDEKWVICDVIDAAI